MSIWETTSLLDLAVPLSSVTAWESGDARIVRVSPDGAIALASPADSRDGGLRMESSASVAFDPERHLHVGQVGGVPVFAAIGTAAGQVSLREALVQLSGVDVELAMRASAMVQFHAANQFCPQCGRPTRVGDAGHARWCEACQTTHFPRTDPAIIVAVTDEHNRLLLGHHTGWEDVRYSVFAGFVEAGESLEQAVHREVAEEVGLTLATVTYAGSQPWPMPRSLMAGFTATALPGPARPDGAEISAARWFSTDELREAVSRGDVVLPLRASIAYRLVSRWYGSAL